MMKMIYWYLIPNNYIFCVKVKLIYILYINKLITLLMSRICKNCNIEKDLNDFEITDKAKKLYRRICKKCRVLTRQKYFKTYYINNKESYINREKETCICGSYVSKKYIKKHQQSKKHQRYLNAL